MSVSSKVVWVGVIGSMAFGLYQLKDAVQRSEKELARLERELITSQESIHVLRAEWSYLNRPDRLSALAGRHLALVPVAPNQVGDISALPPRPIEDAVVADLDGAE
jgi:hypothetical protein